MISLEQAKNIAIRTYPDADCCDETKNYFVFYNKKYAGDIGGQSPCVVDKETGEAFDFLAVIADDSLGETIRSYSI